MQLSTSRRRGYGACLAALLVALGLNAAGREATLAEAVKSGDAAALRALIAKHADGNIAAADGTTPLHWAVERDDDAVTDLLLKASARAQVTNRHGVTPLHLAATN